MLFFSLHIFSFLKKKKIENTRIFTFLQRFSQCEAKRLNRLGVTGPTSCRCVCFPVIVSDFIENVCVIFQHVLRAGKVKACPWKRLSWCVMACIQTHDEKGAQHRHSPPWLPGPSASPLSSLRARSQSFATQRASKQSFLLCPQQFVRA